jgi:hypothetical protein
MRSATHQGYRAAGERIRGLAASPVPDLREDWRVQTPGARRRSGRARSHVGGLESPRKPQIPAGAGLGWGSKFQPGTARSHVWRGPGWSP